MKFKLLLSSFIYSLIGALMLTQLTVINVLAVDGNNPITAAITSAINNITNTAQGGSNTPSATPTPNVPSAQDGNNNTSYNLGVLVLKYFPLTSNGQNIDINVTGDVSDSYSLIKQKTTNITNNLLSVIPKATSYLGYLNSNAQPSLTYQIVDTKKYTQAVPTVNRSDRLRYPDYRSVMTTNNICDYVDTKGVREVWLWAYQGPNKTDGFPSLSIFESKMSSPYGDISNSNRYNDMPLCQKSYRVYTFNYGRGTAEAFHSWGHQIEAEIDAVHTESATLNSLFRSSFQGPGRCGSVHNPPNARSEYDYNNPTPQQSDCLNWGVDTIGQTSAISCQNWGCQDLGDSNNPQLNYLTWMWQNLPGRNNTKVFGGLKLRNFWDVHGDFDGVMRNQTFYAVSASQGSSTPTSTTPPMTAPVVNPTPSPTPAPITAPITQPSPTPTSAPLTSPVTNPAPTATPSATPTPTPPLLTNMTLNQNNNQVVINSTTPALNISVSSTATNPIVDFSNLLITSPTAASVIVQNSISVDRPTSLGNINVQLPSAIMISGPASWNGVWNAPTILATSSITPPADLGMRTITSGVVEVGAADMFLTLDKAVRILIPGQAGKLVGYSFTGNFTKIPQACSADSQAAGDNLIGGGNCYINVGNDLVVWTKHFTKFVTYSQTTAQSTDTSSNSVLQPAAPSYNTQAPVCGDSKPTSAPKISSAFSAEPNTVVLVWSKANDPVSYYLIAYGTKSGKMEYGNPNVGDKNTTSYKVKGLSGGQTYYFKVRAGNNCMPGEFSNEAKVTVVGSKLNTKVADNFKEGVLATNNHATNSASINLPFKPITYGNPARFITESTNFLTKIFSFITHLFKP